MPQPQKPNTLSHFSINAEDVDRALAFYRNVFGWSFTPWGPPGFHMTDAAGGPHASVQKRQDTPFPTHIGNFECTITVDDVDRAVELILANGGQVDLPKVTIPTVADIARVRDSEGNTFSIARYL